MASLKERLKQNWTFADSEYWSQYKILLTCTVAPKGEVQIIKVKVIDRPLFYDKDKLLALEESVIDAVKKSWLFDSLR